MVASEQRPEEESPSSGTGLPEPPPWEFKRPEKPPTPSLGPLIDFALFRQAGLALSLGIVMVVAPLLGYFLGRWLAGATGETAWVPVGTGFGMVLGVVMILRLVRLIKRDGA